MKNSICLRSQGRITAVAAIHLTGIRSRAGAIAPRLHRAKLVAERGRALPSCPHPNAPARRRAIVIRVPCDVNQIPKPTLPVVKQWKCVELFAGAGGLALGAAKCGFEHLGVVERDVDCCDNIRHNKEAGTHPISKWPLIEGDVKSVDFNQWKGQAHLVCGGPPCQPFSIGGKGAGADDRRDMFPEGVRAVREIRPYAFVFENVRGLLRPGFSNYVEYIRHQLAFPEVARGANESPESHFRRLQELHTRGNGPAPVYQVELHLANAANYGVPQRRQRVFLVGFRRDVGACWSFPTETHSKAALDQSKLTGDYWDRHQIPKKYRKLPDPNDSDLFDASSKLLPWVSARDAIAGLGPPSGTSKFFNHVFKDGARVYPGHTGSPLDEPSKTIKAGAHGVPGGENMVILDNGEVRYFTVRELARIQTFPDEYEFAASWTENMRQLGNAVPCDLAATVIGSVKDSILRALLTAAQSKRIVSHA